MSKNPSPKSSPPSLFQALLHTCLYPYEQLMKFHNHYYSQLETKILEGEQGERYRLKKSIILYHSYLSIIFFTIIPFINPAVSWFKSFVHIASCLFQIRCLHSKNYHLIGSYVYIHALLSVICHSFTEMEPLTLIGMVFANQHIFFLFPESQLLSQIYLPSVIILMGYIQRKFIQNLQVWDDSVEASIQASIALG